jgi:TolB protein
MDKLLSLSIIVITLLFAALEGTADGQTSAGLPNWTVKKLAVEASRGGFPVSQSDIFVIDPPSAKPRRLVDGSGPAWSPDGRTIAYCVREGRGFGQIQIVNSDGSGHRPLTNLKGGGCAPDWSPTGDKIAFTALGGKTPMVAIMGGNGENVTPITEGYGPRWSPDGKQLVFCRSPKLRAAKGSIWIVNADGTGARMVTEDNSNVLQTTWTPDGKSVAFSSEREHKSAIFKVNLDGTGLERVAADKQLELFFPVFSPDGLWLVTDSYPVGSGEATILLLDVGNHQGRPLAHGSHPSVLWEHK